MIIKTIRITPHGFTLIETLMAVLVLSIAIAGPLTIAARGIAVTTIAKDQDTALYLAQDAIEYVRWARDTNTLNGLDWLAGGSIGGSYSTVLTPCVSANGTIACYIDTLGHSPTAPASCGGSSCSAYPLYYDSTNDYYTYNTTGTTPTIFTRTITIQTPVGGNANEARVTVVVSWCDQASVCATTPRSVTTTEDIFNWQ